MTRQTVLVDDDDADIRAFLKIKFESWSFEVVTAEDGAGAAASAADIDADLIPLDMNMPSISGFEAARQIRATEKHSRTPIIAVTAHTSTGDRDEAYQAGCNAIVTKPIDPQKLSQAVTDLLGPLQP
ncbi:MAG: response regulator [Pseudomonadota bacterium]|nr:response regulator [Pseudomonadota bacterium]